MKKFAVIGLGRLGFHVAHALNECGTEVLAIDSNPNLIQQIKDDVTHAVCTDTTTEENLRALALQEFDAVVITIGVHSLESSILTTALVAKIGVPHIIARSTSQIHAQILKLVGAHELINPESDLAERIAQRVARPAILDLIQLSDDGYSLSEISAPPRFHGKSLAQAKLRKNHGINVLGIKRHTHRIRADGTEETRDYVDHNPSSTHIIQACDILICLGTLHDIECFASLDA